MSQPLYIDLKFIYLIIETVANSTSRLHSVLGCLIHHLAFHFFPPVFQALPMLYHRGNFIPRPNLDFDTSKQFELLSLRMFTAVDRINY